VGNARRKMLFLTSEKMSEYKKEQNEFSNKFSIIGNEIEVGPKNNS
jgi:hypothetical protein